MQFKFAYQQRYRWHQRAVLNLITFVPALTFAHCQITCLHSVFALPASYNACHLKVILLDNWAQIFALQMHYTVYINAVLIVNCLITHMNTLLHVPDPTTPTT